VSAHITSHRCKTSTLEKRFPGARIIDVASKGPEPWVRFSPFYPHGNIPVPNSPDYTAQSVEGVWQGLKVFETEDVDVSIFPIIDMRGINAESAGADAFFATASAWIPTCCCRIERRAVQDLPADVPACAAEQPCG
jgi:hypothetical protein